MIGMQIEKHEKKQPAINAKYWKTHKMEEAKEIKNKKNHVLILAAYVSIV